MGSFLAHAPDRALLHACATYWEANAQLNDLLMGNTDPADAIGLGLHRKWTQALSRVLSLPADTAEGERARSAVLRDAVEIVLGQGAEEDLDSDGLARLLPRGLLS